MKDELRQLAGELNDKSRETRVLHNKAVVPLKFDEEGNPATPLTVLFKTLNINDLRFLSAWKKLEYEKEPSVVADKLGLEFSRAERLIKRLSAFRRENALTLSLCEIPTVEWIKSKHVENFYQGGTLDDSSHKSLQELAKIEGAYKNNLNVSVTQNVFNLPKLDPATEEKLKVIAQQEAQIIQEAQLVSNG